MMVSTLVGTRECFRKRGASYSVSYSDMESMVPILRPREEREDFLEWERVFSLGGAFGIFRLKIPLTQNHQTARHVLSATQMTRALQVHQPTEG